MRKLPIRHNVSGHYRQGKWINNFSRGSGEYKKKQRASKVVISPIPIEISRTHKMFNRVAKYNTGDYFGWCGLAAVALAYQIGGDVVFGKFLNDEMYETVYAARHTGGVDHVWVEKNGMIYDPTAEQFMGVTGPIVTLETDKRYTPHNEETAWASEFDSGVIQPLRWNNNMVGKLLKTKDGNKILEDQGIIISDLRKLMVVPRK